MKTALTMLVLFAMLIVSACANNSSPPGSASVEAIPTPTPARMMPANEGGMEHSMASSSAGMAHMMEPISAEGVQPATQDQGGQPLEFRLEDGVKVFEITTKPVQWKILDDVMVTAWTYNGTVQVQ